MRYLAYKVSMQFLADKKKKKKNMGQFFFSWGSHIWNFKYLACMVQKLCYALTRGQWAMFGSPELNSHCISADAMQQSSNIATATRREIWQCRKKVKDHPRIIIWTNHRPCVPDAIYQDSASKLSWFRREVLKCFYQIWAWQPYFS